MTNLNKRNRQQKTLTMKHKRQKQNLNKMTK